MDAKFKPLKYIGDTGHVKPREEPKSSTDTFWQDLIQKGKDKDKDNDTVESDSEELIEGDAVVIRISELLSGLSSLSSDCCINKVPKKLRSINEEAYTPRVISIGPLHHGREDLKGMEQQKLRYLQSFLFRTRLKLDTIVEALRLREKRARQYYAETVSLNSHDFVQMLVLDSIFVVELLWRFCFPDSVDKTDRIFQKPHIVDDVARDMTLLENQLPFFVVERLFALLCKYVNRNDLSLIDMAHKFFKHLVKMDKLPQRMENHVIRHFVDLFREYHVPSSPRSWEEGNREDEIPPSVTELHEAGVKFEKGKGNSLLDIEFSKGILRIPPLEIDDETETFFRNLIAFEQCEHSEKYITHYMLFMDGLINTPQDVDLLIWKGIITRKLGSSEDVSTLFNKICNGVIGGHKFYFFNLCKELKAYCRIPHHHYLAILRRDYFNTPWAILSFIAAFTLVVLTFIQAICSILSL